MNTFYLLSDLVPALLAEHEKARAAAAANRPAGPITGFPSVDNACGGCLHAGLHVIQGAPGDGKTALALQVASQCLCPALFVSVEMAAIPLFRRIVARETRTSLQKLDHADSQQLHDLAERAAKSAPYLAIVDGTVKHCQASFIQEVGNELRRRAGTDQLLLIIDSLQAWSRGHAASVRRKHPPTEYEVIAHGVTHLRELALTLHTPAMLLSHRNRVGQQSGGLFAAKGSGDIEYGAESVLELTRDQSAPPSAAGEVNVDIAMLKNRNGAAGVKISFRFCGSLQLFREAETPEKRYRHPALL